MSFKSYDKLTDTFYWDSGVNFTKFWTELTQTSIITDALKNSIIVWIFTSVLGTFLSILFSYYIYKKWVLGKTFKFFLFLPSVLPSILLVIVFKFFANEAVPGYMYELFGENISPLLRQGSDTLMPTIIFYNVWVCFGAQLLIYTGAMDQIPPEIIEAGKVDGVSPVREFFSIVVPMILPTVSTFVVANVATLFTNQANLWAFFGDSNNVDYANFTIGYYLFDLVNKGGLGKSMYTYASALGVICTLIAFPLTMLARKLLNREDE
jgi:ABC-type sugar transport system permease subunit